MTAEEFKNKILPVSRKLYPMIFRMLKDEEETRDALQDLMLKLWNKRGELDNFEKPAAYMVTMAKNYCIDLMKKKRPVNIGEEEQYRLYNLQADGQDPETRERYEQVHKIIEKLPEKFRTVIRMRDIDGFTFDEIKEMTGYEKPNLRVILSRARSQVKKELEKIYNYDRSREVTQQIL